MPGARGWGQEMTGWELRFVKVFLMIVKSSDGDIESSAASSKEMDDCILSRAAMGIFSDGECC